VELSPLAVSVEACEVGNINYLTAAMTTGDTQVKVCRTAASHSITTGAATARCF
jgi:hypothetical protein